jgi:hypothetical protein
MIEHEVDFMRYFGANGSNLPATLVGSRSMRPLAELNQCRRRAAFAMQGSLRDASLYCLEWPNRFTHPHARFRI